MPPSPFIAPPLPSHILNPSSLPRSCTFGKASFLAATLMFIAGARAQCPDNAVGVGQKYNSAISAARMSNSFRLLAGSTNQAAVKRGVSGNTADLCGDYAG
ncbi:hypothetical protein B0H13DRAFT_1893434 [Mycena leptocephala]|nr:hypothetical protein B0H13DRAFT_1893434 [Mycena leptocephala]